MPGGMAANPQPLDPVVWIDTQLGAATASAVCVIFLMYKEVKILESHLAALVLEHWSRVSLSPRKGLFLFRPPPRGSFPDPAVA